MNLEDFSGCCIVKLCREDGHARLTVACVATHDGKRVIHKKEIDLDPLVKHISGMLARYHQELHGQPPIGGAWDDLIVKAEEMARRVGEARLVEALFGEVSPLLGEGDEDIEDSDTNQKAYQILTSARNGDAGALEIIGALVNSAYRGNARALEIVVFMRKLHMALEGKQAAGLANVSTAGMTMPQLVEIGSWFSGLKNIAKKVGKVATAPLWAPTYLATKAISKVPGLRAVNKINPAAWAINAMEGKKRRPARKVTASWNQPRGPVGPELQQPPMPEVPGNYDPGDYADDYGSDEYGEEPEFAGPQAEEEVSGWAFNKGYRPSANPRSMRGFYSRGQATVGAEVPDEEVSGWLFNRGYRSPSEVANSARGLYTGGAIVAGEVISVGWGWSDLMKQAKKVVRTTTKTVKAVASNPIVKAVAPIVANVVPGGGMAYAAAQKAHDILQAAKKGNPAAVEAIAVVRDWAVEGNPKAVATVQVMKTMSDAIDAKALTAPVTPAPAALPAPAPLPVGPELQQLPMPEVPGTYSAPVYDGRGSFQLWGKPSGYYGRGLGQ